MGSNGASTLSVGFVPTGVATSHGPGCVCVSKEPAGLKCLVQCEAK